MDNQPRDEVGRFDKKRNNVAIILTIAAILTAIYVNFIKAPRAGGQEATPESSVDRAARMIVEQMPTAKWEIAPGAIKSSTSTKMHNFSKPEDIEKWMEWQESHIEALEVKLGEPKTILKIVCRDNGISDPNCPKILYGMAWQESVFGKYMTGDGGKSAGWFHIMYYHEVTPACSHDLACAADWTIKRMIRFGFGKSKQDTETAIMAHNGTPNTKVTRAYLASVMTKSKLWDKNP